MYWHFAVLLAVSLSLCAQSEDLQPGPTEKEVEDFALRVHREAAIGERVPLPDDVLRKSLSSIGTGNFVCNPLHRTALRVYRIPYGAKHYEAVAVQGRGPCYCSLTGNCWFWIYRLRGGGKYEKIFATNEALNFGFVHSRAPLPILVIWTLHSPTTRAAHVLQFNGSEYLETGRWREEFQYEEEEGELAFHPTPKISSYFGPGEFLPN